jgi:hypothetical protein
MRIHNYEFIYLSESIITRSLRCESLVITDGHFLTVKIKREQEKRELGHVAAILCLLASVCVPATPATANVTKFVSSEKFHAYDMFFLSTFIKAGKLMDVLHEKI